MPKRRDFTGYDPAKPGADHSAVITNIGSEQETIILFQKEELLRQMDELLKLAQSQTGFPGWFIQRAIDPDKKIWRIVPNCCVRHKLFGADHHPCAGLNPENNHLLPEFMEADWTMDGVE